MFFAWLALLVIFVSVQAPAIFILWAVVAVVYLGAKGFWDAH